MDSVKSRRKSFGFGLALIFLLSGGPVDECMAQDPSGRPPGTTPRSKRPVKKPAGRAEPQPLTVTLTVLTEPPESAVYINGEQRGVTNAEGKIQFDKLPLGQYSIGVRKDGYNPLLRGFQAGTESPTLVFKLTPSLDDVIKEFNTLTAEGKLTGPETPNALALVKDLATKFPDNPEIVRMRGVLAAKMSESAAQVIARTTSDWRRIKREEVASAAEVANTAATLKSDDKRIQAQAAYLRAVLSLLDHYSGGGSSNANASQNGEAGPDGALLSEVRSELERAIGLDDAWVAPHYQLGHVLLEQGDARGAEAVFLRVTQLEPRWPMAHVSLGSAYSAGSKYKEAIDAYRKAIELDANLAPAHAGLGLARALKGESKEGIKDIQKAMQLDSSSALPHRNLGIVYSQIKKGKEGKKEITQAVEELKTALSKNPQNLEFRNKTVEKMIADLEARRKK
ncbi:MAG TPA: tetratricopeptide repeat protein [Blastocatellia bacterium]|nr:tetratricopeptide repeat protein [Blastocatellia bacterium]